MEEEKTPSPPARTMPSRTNTPSPSKASASTSRRGSGERDDVSPTSGKVKGAEAEGWDNFAVAQKGAVWMEGYVQGYQAVRRRLWRRVYLDRGSGSADHDAGGAAVAVPPPL